MANDLNDSLDGLFGGDTGPVRTVPVKPVPEFKSAVDRFEESCPKCRGRGRFISYTGRDVGPCFTCKGNGKQVFKTSADSRAKSRNNAAARKAERKAADMIAFMEREPEVTAWIQTEMNKAQPFAFAVAMHDALVQWGDLTAGQLAACHKLVARNVERQAAKAAAVANAPAVDVAKLETAFATARKNAERPGQKGVMVKAIKLQSDNGQTVKFTPGSIGSTWEGMIFAKSADGKKLGHVKGGRFIAKFDCTEVEKAAVIDCATDPEKAAVAFGKAFSSCGMCGRGLLNDESIARGIGPICAERFGW